MRIGIYSPTGQRTSMTDATGNTGYAYDKRDRLQQKTVTWSNWAPVQLYYGYDANGNLTSLGSSTSGGVTNFYQYDALNRLTNVVASGAQAAGYAYDGVGNQQSLVYPNGYSAYWQYDPMNRLTNLVWVKSSTTNTSFYYQLGRTGNRTNLSEKINNISQTYSWTYDSLYRLKQETFGGATTGSASYVYDLLGNRTSRTTTPSVSTILTNQPFTFNSNDWLTGDTYDSNGNTLTSLTNSYQYDALNHLTNAPNVNVKWVYDGDGNRVRKLVKWPYPRRKQGIATHQRMDADRMPAIKSTQAIAREGEWKEHRPCFLVHVKDRLTIVPINKDTL
jgi:YD repeat-containing protein